MDWKLTKEAEVAKKQLAEDGETEHAFGGSDGFWYDITDGGYFKPEEALADPEQIEKVKDAVALLKDLEDSVYSEIVHEF